MVGGLEKEYGGRISGIWWRIRGNMVADQEEYGGRMKGNIVSKLK